MSVWVRAAAAELLTAVASIYFYFFLEWGPVLGISLAQPIFHLEGPGQFFFLILNVFLAITTLNLYLVVHS